VSLLREEIFSQAWPTKPLGEIVEFLDNLRKPVKSSDRIEGPYNYYGANGLQGTIDDFLFDEPLVLLAEDGGHFGNPERDIAYIAEGKYWVNNHAHVLKPHEGLDLRFLYRVLQKYDVSKYIKGATRAKLTKGDAAVMPIPIPPLAEQKRIAAILDKADAIRRKRQQAIQLADEFLRAVFLDMFGDPVTNPKGWEVKLLKDISRIQIGPFGTQLHKEDYVQGGIPIINPTHIVRGNIVSKDDFTITAAKHASLPEYHLDIGDIIMGRRGEMGRCAVVGANEKGWLCGTGSLFIRPSKTGVFSEYLNRLLASDAIKKHLESESQGATMPNLNKTIVGNIQIPVPSDEALNQFSAIKEKIIGTKSLYLSFAREKMFESLSQKTFSGKL